MDTNNELDFVYDFIKMLLKNRLSQKFRDKMAAVRLFCKTGGTTFGST
jgi:hypothetical protein